MKLFLMLLFSVILAGCGTTQVVRNGYGRAQYITESAYTSKGCISKLKDKAAAINVKVTTATVERSTAKLFLWPFVKATTCMAEVE